MTYTESESLPTFTDEEIQKQREKRDMSNRISQLMGKYMLQRWRMLDSQCQKCDTILLEKPTGEKYCVYCEELRDTNVVDSHCVSETILSDGLDNAMHASSKSSTEDRRKREERFDEISKLTSKYLLSGWIMLASTCQECGTILLRQKGGPSTYCVACEELDEVTSESPDTEAIKLDKVIVDSSSMMHMNNCITSARLNLGAFLSKSSSTLLTSDAVTAERHLRNIDSALKLLGMLGQTFSA